MSGWGIAPTAPEIEKIKAESADYLNGLNACCVIDYGTYSYAFDFYADLIDKAYEQGKKDNNELRFLPSAQPEHIANVSKKVVPCEDAVSRQAAIDAVIKRDANCGIDSAEVLKDLPSAEPERKTGRWIKDSDVAFHWKCSECGSYLFWDKTKYFLREEDKPIFCPNCGSYNGGEE